jgi:DNA-binding beta-propeller fold protein YncE
LLRGDDLVEADGYGGTLYTVNLSTGALVWRITGQQYDLDDAIGESLDPDAIALSGDDLFTVGLYSDAVTEVNASTGALVKVTRGYANGAPLAGTGWAWPDAIVANSSSLLLCSAPTGSGSVSDLDPSTGSVAWRAVAPNFDDPDAIAADGADFFVTAGLSNSVTEFNSSTGAVVKQMVGPQYGFAYPDALALNGDDLFVANYGGSVTEMNTLTGAVVRQISGPQYGFAYPAAITIDGNDLFVANYEGRSVTEVDAATGALVRVMAGPQYDFEGPDAIASSGAYLYVANGLGNWVTEVDISTGSVVRLIAGLR